MKTLLKSLLLLPIPFMLIACGAGNGEGLNDQGRPNAETPVALPPDNPPSAPPNEPPTTDPNIISANLASIQQHVFTPVCAVVCHGGANPAAGQDLSTIENSVANLINVQSSNPLFKRVLPGNPEQSYLYLKITGDAQAGARMPLGQPALPDEAIKAIKEWIAQGAIVPDNIMTPTRINQLKINTEKVNASQQKIIITLSFNQQINFSTLTTEQILISEYQYKNQVEQQQLLPLTSDNISFNSIDAHHLTIAFITDTVSDTTEKLRHFNLQLNKPNLSTITSISGQMLDGDNANIDGGVFSYDFSL